MERFNNSTIALIGGGEKIREDIKYVFDNARKYIDIELNQVANLKEEEVEKIDYVILCDSALDERDVSMFSVKQIIDIGRLGQLLDKSLLISTDKKIAIYGISEITDIVIENIKNVDVVISRENDACKTYCGKKVVTMSDISIEDYYFIIAEKEFDQAICELEDLGLVVNDDFIDGAIYTMPKYSEMFYKTLNATPTDNINCELPFYNFIIDANMNPYPCCPSGIVPEWIDKERLYFKSCDELWMSMWFKLFRLSAINKTYCFCNPHFCNRLKTNPGIGTERFEREVCQKPTTMQVEFDYTCNLHCPSCRSGIAVATPYRRRILDKVVNDFKEKRIMDDLEWTRLAGYGDVFASKYYQDLLYSDKKRKNLFLITNAVLFTEDKFDRLVGCYENIDIYVSIDAATENTYNKLRPGGSWSKLIENLRMISRKKDEGLVRFFRIQMVVQNDNYREIPGFVKLGMELDVSSVYFSNIRQWGHMSDDEFARATIMDKDYKIKDEVKTFIDDQIVKNAPNGLITFDFMK